MKKALIAILPILFSSVVHASCYGSDSFRNCYDSSGNSYSIRKIGNRTYVDGSNPNGSQWSQTYNTIGNTTYVDGTASNGNSWNETIRRIGNHTYYDGTDSNGNSFSKTCYRNSFSGSMSCY